MIHQAILAALSGTLHAMQYHAAYLPFRRVVIAIGMPFDGTVGIGDICLPLPIVSTYGDARDALFACQPIRIQAIQSELRSELAHHVLIGHIGAGGIDRHVAALATWRSM